jgi:hypothetical protein
MVRIQTMMVYLVIECLLGDMQNIGVIGHTAFHTSECVADQFPLVDFKLCSQ